MSNSFKITFQDISDIMINKWQDIVDLIANVISVPAALIMKFENDNVEVFLSSKTKNNSYHVGDKENIHGLYHEIVIKSRKEIVIKNAVFNPHGKIDSDLDTGMIAYMGYPVNFPDNTPFGTLCVCDYKENDFSFEHQKLMSTFRDFLERDLESIQNKFILDSVINEHRNNVLLFQEMFSVIPDMISIHDPDMNIVYSNWNGFASVSEEKRKFGTKCYSTYRNLHGICPDCKAKQALKTKKMFQKEIELPEGIWVDLRIIPIVDSKGNPYLFMEWMQDITQRKIAEKKIFESEENYRILVENANDIIFSITTEGIITYVSPNWMTIVDESAEELIGKPVAQLIHPDDVDLCRSFFQEILRTGKKLSGLEYRIKHHDNTWHWHVTNGAPIKDSSGNVTQLMGVGRDVTLQKKAEEVIISERKQLISIFNSIDEPIYVSNTDTYELLFVNQALIKTLGKNPIGGICYRELQGRESPCEFCTNNIICRNHEPYQWEFYNPTLGRTYVLYDRIIRWSDGRDVRLELAVDVTDLKKAEEKLSAEKEQLSVTLRSIGDGVITTDINGNINLINKIAEKLTGWSQDEAYGKDLGSVFKIINELTEEPCENPVQKVLSTGSIIELANHTLLISRDGTKRVIADSGAPIKDKFGNTTGVVLVFRDMTEKQKFLEITQNTQKLESLGILAGGIAHDFNNLLGGVFGYIDLAKEYSNETKIQGYLSKAIQAIERSRALTHQLLTFAKGGTPLQKAGSLFPFIKDTAQFALSGSNVSCSFDIPNDLWPSNFDKNQIGQVIDNLVINAQQAMPLGGIIQFSACNIYIEEKKHPILSKGKYVRLSIQDSGIGIPKELKNKIFDPFFTTKTKGHGLGLATCYSIITRHCGCIEVESEAGKGSNFIIYLPAATEPVSETDITKTTTHTGYGAFLVMDDEEVIRETVKIILESLGYSVVCKKNGNEAVDYFEAEMKANRTFSGMIFDLTVPGAMNGKEAVAYIRKHNKDIPIFVASGYADDPIMKNPSKYGFTDSICKPFLRKDLIKLLEKHVK